MAFVMFLLVYILVDSPLQLLDCIHRPSTMAFSFAVSSIVSGSSLDIFADLSMLKACLL